jgi:uncharacterized protein (TIGR02145 family)
MTSGDRWMTTNLSADAPGSACYENNPANCSRFGRLYAWPDAMRVCNQLGDGWRLPSNSDWERLAAQYGGVDGVSADSGRSAYAALVSGGRSGFNALLGGGRDVKGDFARLDAHGFYWTSTESDSATAWFYNFGKGGLALHRHSDGEKGRGFAVRCIHR